MSNDQEIFGPLILGTQVEEAIQAVLENWLPTYLGYVDRLLGKHSATLEGRFSFTKNSKVFKVIEPAGEVGRIVPNVSEVVATEAIFAGGVSRSVITGFNVAKEEFTTELEVVATTGIKKMTLVNLWEAWLAVPQSWTISSDWDHFPEEATPAVLIMSRGIEEPAMGADRQYRGKFLIRIGVFVQAFDRTSTEQLAKYYAAAIRATFLQHGNLEKKLGEFVATAWKGEEYGVHISDRSQRTFGTAEVRFATEVRGLVRRGGGLLSPAVQPQSEPPKWPTVKEEPSNPKLDPEALSENVETE